jgi:hypothetical protein
VGKSGFYYFSRRGGGKVMTNPETGQQMWAVKRADLHDSTKDYFVYAVTPEGLAWDKKDELDEDSPHLGYSVVPVLVTELEKEEG